MPENETETHPYLHFQVNDFNESVKLSNYCKLIVGTFPIYAITDSEPIENHGVVIRENWINYAFMKYFYGSRRNRFWELFAECFNEPIPVGHNDAIELLDRYKFLITDIVSSTQRNGYSSSDAAISGNKLFNFDLISSILVNVNHLKIIYFTSRIAKRWFCECLNIPFLDVSEEISVIENRRLLLIVLIPPHGNGLRRGQDFYLDNFPLNAQELLKKPGYTTSYKQRYYCNYLKLNCAETVNIKK